MDDQILCSTVVHFYVTFVEQVSQTVECESPSSHK